MRLGLFCAVLFTGAANAGPRTKATQEAAKALPELAATLEAAGWTMTPERSATYAAGDIYRLGDNSPIVFRADCFDAEPRRGAYTSLEVVQAMEAGGRVPLGVAHFKAAGMQYKQVTFADPEVSELSQMHLQPNESCVAYLGSIAAQGEDLGALYVLQAVLSAVVNEQMCQDIDVSAGVGAAGAYAGLSQECSQGSIGQVVVAYKTRPITSLLGLEGLADTSPVASPEPEPTSHAPGTVAVSLGGDGVDFASLAADAEAAKRARVSADQASRAAEAALQAERQRRLDAAVSRVQEEATRDYASIASLVATPTPEAGPVLQAWLDRYAAATVAVDGVTAPVPVEELGRVRDALSRAQELTRKAEERPASPDAAARAHGDALRLGDLESQESPEDAEVAAQKRLQSIAFLKELLATGRAQGDQKAEMMLRLADLYFLQGRYEKSGSWSSRAATLFEQLIQSHPTYARLDEALFYRGSALRDSGDDRTALETFTSLLKQYPASPYVPDTYVLIGEYHYDEGNAYKAMLAYQRAVAYPGSASYAFAKYKLAWCQYAVGEVGAAVESMKEVVAHTSAATAGRGRKPSKREGEVTADPNRRLMEQALVDLVVLFAGADVNEGREYFTSMGRSDLAVRLAETR